MRRIAGFFMLLLAPLIGLCACSMSVHPVTPSATLIKHIGLPIYPHARNRYTMEVSQPIRSHEMDSLVMTFETRDDLNTVDRFYAQRLPKTAQRTVIPLGVLGSITYQFFDTTGQKAVRLRHIKDVTTIQLQLTTFKSVSPQPSHSSRN